MNTGSEQNICALAASIADLHRERLNPRRSASWPGATAAAPSIDPPIAFLDGVDLEGGAGTG